MDVAISALFMFLADILKWCLDGMLWVLGKALFLPFDGLLTTISSIFTAIDLSTYVSSYAMNWAGLPTQMIWLVNAVGLPQGITIISSSIVIRMLINLIPAEFTRV